MELFGGITLLHLGGHFPSSTALHWAKGADGKGILCASASPVSVRGWFSHQKLLHAPDHRPLPPQWSSQDREQLAALVFVSQTNMHKYLWPVPTLMNIPT